MKDKRDTVCRHPMKEKRAANTERPKRAELDNSSMKPKEIDRATSI